MDKCKSQKNRRPFQINRETLRRLADNTLADAAGQVLQRGSNVPSCPDGVYVCLFQPPSAKTC